MSNLERVTWSLCPYETVVNDVVAPCGRPCQGDYCLEHQPRLDAVADLEKEVNRAVKGRKK